MNPVYNPAAAGVPFTNTKGMAYPGNFICSGFPVGYATAAPPYNPNIYAGANPGFPSGYAPGTPFKMSCSPNNGTVPPYSSSPNPYQAAMYPVRSTYPQQNPYAQALIPSQQQGTYYTQPLYAAPPHVIHHTTVVQPNGMHAAMYTPHMPPQRHNSVAMGMVAGTTMAMSAGEHRLKGTLLTTQSPASVAPHQVTMPTYRPPGTPGYSYVPPQW
ncbi:myelin-associated neurite-outgrowth inhibitor isoform X1 [Eleginops maclovinus]|uniref:myelin-associated neurite-outgrowth inhibitor isoform X1 n=1 Tax=Eleginops maclovinus TaxID=56733 RepID=UPI00308048CA